MANKEKMVIQKPGVFPETVGWSTGSVLFRRSVNSNSTKTKKCPLDWAIKGLSLTMMKAGLMKWWGQKQAREKDLVKK